MDINIIEKYKGLKIEKVEGLHKESPEVTFHLRGGGRLTFLHYQDCCEDVRLVDFEDYSLDGFEGATLREITEASECAADEEEYESRTWTFYTVRTSKGDLWMRWLGESNGYYSEEVSIEFIPATAALKIQAEKDFPYLK